MIVVNAKIQASRETIEALTPVVAELEAKTRQEKGCLDYAFSIEIHDPETVRITEKWIDQASLEAHMREPHFLDFQKAAAENPPKSIEATFYEAHELPSPF